MRWMKAIAYDVFIDTFFEFPPVTGLEIHRSIHPRVAGVSPCAHAQGLLTAYAWHRRAGR